MTLHTIPLNGRAVPPGATSGFSDSAVCGWLAQAEAGDILEYHRGFLVLDISPAARRLSDVERATLIRVARRVLWAAENNLVHLVQRRLGAEDFHYLAIVRPRPRGASASLSALLSAEAA